jgi:hypothetical protein
MKKILLVLVFSFSVMNVCAQYYPMLDTINRWTYTENQIGVLPPLNERISSTFCNYPYYPYSGLNSSMYTGNDTIINSMTYKILLADDWSLPCTYGYLREDIASQKIYFLDVMGNPEILLYDFSMQIGDTININFFTSGYFETGTYRLDSIGTMTISAGTRRVFYLNCQTCSNSRTLPWVESLGNLGDVIYPYSQNYEGSWFQLFCPDFPHDYTLFVTCFEHNQKVYYDSCALANVGGCFLYYDTCHYWNICGDIDELNLLQFSIIPNPSQNKFTVESEIEINDAILEIYNTLGTKIFETTLSSKHQTLNTNLPAGIYFVNLRNERNSYNQKLIIE